MNQASDNLLFWGGKQYGGECNNEEGSSVIHCVMILHVKL